MRVERDERRKTRDKRRETRDERQKTKDESKNEEINNTILYTIGAALRGDIVGQGAIAIQKCSKGDFSVVV